MCGGRKLKEQAVRRGTGWKKSRTGERTSPSSSQPYPGPAGGKKKIAGPLKRFLPQKERYINP